ncbi:MAG: ATP-dependent DNA ligase, partial [Acidimicrobiales bacterium]
MDLPVMPPVSPMLAKLARGLPAGGEVVYEPKWDGFRTVVFRDGDEVELGSRNERPLTRYFPELLDPLRASLPGRCVVDGEIVIAGPDGLDFDSLLQRIHPAQSRVQLLAAETPASFVAFDLLALGDEDLRPLPFGRRRSALEGAFAGARPPIHLTPATGDRALAGEWFERFEGAGLDGVVVKAAGMAYREGQRAMVKVKHERTADCVVAGFRWHKTGQVVGSLLLGLYDGDGTPDGAGILHHVGVTASFTDRRRRELVEELA